MAIMQNKNRDFFVNSHLDASPKGTKNLHFLFNAQTIAVIGASPNPEKIGHEILKNIVAAGYSGKIFPVNPTATKILNLETFPSIKAVAQKIDFAIIAIPAPLVAEVLEECGQAQVKTVAVITSGFAEIGKIEEEKNETPRSKLTRYLSGTLDLRNPGFLKLFLRR